MERKELLEWAINGLHAEIAKLEKDINTGKQLLLQYERRQKPKTTKTPEEIKEIIYQKREEIEILDKKRFGLTWEIALMEADEE